MCAPEKRIKTRNMKIEIWKSERKDEDQSNEIAWKWKQKLQFEIAIVLFVLCCWFKHNFIAFCKHSYLVSVFCSMWTLLLYCLMSLNIEHNLTHTHIPHIPPLRRLLQNTHTLIQMQAAYCAHLIFFGYTAQLHFLSSIRVLSAFYTPNFQIIFFFIILNFYFAFISTRLPFVKFSLFLFFRF